MKTSLSCVLSAARSGSNFFRIKAQTSRKKFYATLSLDTTKAENFKQSLLVYFSSDGFSVFNDVSTNAKTASH
ncbi:MAG: hypothetical protein CBB95_16065 [Alteromonas sp. TMED35]|nr:MAG: hypothetical protein CBB95_16065 [Alteromonas sp. TMED35]